MLFRVLLLLSVLLAPVEGAPINTRPRDPRAVIPADHYSMFNIPAAVCFFSGFLFGVICTIIFGHLKKNFRREVTRQDGVDADIKSRAAPSGEPEDETTIIHDDAPHGPIIHDDAPHGPMAEPRDVHKDTNISSPGPHYVLTDIDPYEDMIISSDKEQEDEIPIVIDDAPHGPIIHDDAPHGPMAEQRDTNISTPGPDYVIITIDPYDDEIISFDKMIKPTQYECI
ncbi:uncharacterized protein LOC143817601 [Ranitomeya variabilis]|uniref:uncharacterized protein LOC143817601 n=1 Tax=Ranitomeya variabilis TaxID=490064 RepID=UPI004056A474